MKFTMLFSSGKKSCTESRGFECVARYFIFFLRLLREIRARDVIFAVLSIVVYVFIEKDILNELNSF